jgi:tRNA (guanine6-N2)-methyltransferase
MTNLRRTPTILAHVVPGLERIAGYELGQRQFVNGPVQALTGFDERSSLLRFRSSAPAAELLTLRTVEDVFTLAADMEGVGWNFSGLRELREAIGLAPGVDAAAAFVLATRGRRIARPGLRVIARVAGEHTFRRADLQQTVERALLERFPTWRLVEERATLEVWVNLIEEHFIAGVRLSDNTLRQRTYKRASVPASLKPTVAAAMALISQPRDDDVVLDPMCGAGTLLIERAEAGRYRQLLGGDVVPAAVAAAMENVGPRYRPIDLREWDARFLPLTDASVTAILSNLPFGRKIGARAANRALYPALLAEWSRVLGEGGRMVLLTSESALLATAVAGRSELRLVERIPVLVRGQAAAIHLIQATSRTPPQRTVARATE